MAIQQVVPITLSLMGDSTSTTWKYTITSLFGFDAAADTFHLVSTSNVPSGVVATSNLGHVTASIIGTTTKQLQLVFTTAPPSGQIGQVQVSFYYNSQ